MLRLRANVSGLLSVSVAFAFMGCGSGQVHPIRFDNNKQVGTYLSSDLKGVQSETHASFTLVNTSVDARSIRLMGRSCGCAVAEVNGQPLKDGDVFSVAGGSSVDFSIGLNISRGPKTYDVSAVLEELANNNSRSSTLHSVNYFVQVIDDLAIEPASLNVVFEPHSECLRKQQVVVTRSARGRLAEESLTVEGDVTALCESCEVLSVDVDDEVEDRLTGLNFKKWRVKFVFKKGAPGAKTSSAVKLVVRGEHGDTVAARNLPISVRNRYGVEAPSVVEFGFVKLGATRNRRVLLRSSDGLPFAILGVTHGPEFDTFFEREHSSNTHWLEIEFVPTTLGEVVSQLRVVTNAKVGKDVEIRLSGTGALTEKEKQNRGRFDDIPGFSGLLRVFVDWLGFLPDLRIRRSH